MVGAPKIGKTAVAIDLAVRVAMGAREYDTIRAVSWLSARPDVDKSAIMVYGKGAQGMVALHAAVLGFTHPITGVALRFQSPPPADMQTLLAALRAL